jgi:hypothetical protein
MFFKKITIVVLSILFLTTLLLSQSLVEAAKKEKERRASLKGKKRIVATNAEITRSIKRTATSVSGTEIRESTPSPRTDTARADADRRSSPTGDQTESSALNDEKAFRQRRASLEEKWNRAQEYSDLLATKMNGLWQEFYNLGNDMTYRGKIQADISETYLKLQRSREEEAKAKQEVDAFLEDARRQGVPPGWLR